MKSQKLRVKLVLLSVVRAKIISYLLQGHCTLKKIFNLTLQLYPNCLHCCCVFSYFNGNFYCHSQMNSQFNQKYIWESYMDPKSLIISLCDERGAIWTYILTKLVHRKFSK